MTNPFKMGKVILIEFIFPKKHYFLKIISTLRKNLKVEIAEKVSKFSSQAFVL